MATYEKSLNILPEEYWTGGTVDGTAYEGAENFLYPEGWSGADPLVGNPWLNQYLSAMQGAGEGWAGTGDSLGSFRPMASYIPFAERGADAQLPEFSTEGLNFDPTIWDDKSRQDMGVTGSLGNLWTQEMSQKYDPALRTPGYSGGGELPINPLAGIPQYAYAPMQRLGWNPDQEGSFAPFTPEGGFPRWDNLDWDVRSEALDQGVFGGTDISRGTVAGDDYRNEWLGANMSTGFQPNYPGMTKNPTLPNQGPFGILAGSGATGFGPSGFDYMGQADLIGTPMTSNRTGNESQALRNLYNRVATATMGTPGQVDSYDSSQFIDPISQAHPIYGGSMASDPYTIDTPTTGLSQFDTQERSLLPGITGYADRYISNPGSPNLGMTNAIRPWTTAYDGGDMAQAMMGSVTGSPLNVSQLEKMNEVTQSQLARTARPEAAENLANDRVAPLMAGVIPSEFTAGDFSGPGITNPGDPTDAMLTTALSPGYRKPAEALGDWISGAGDKFKDDTTGVGGTLGLQMANYIRNNPNMDRKTYGTIAKSAAGERDMATQAIGDLLQADNSLSPYKAIGDIYTAHGDQGNTLQKALTDLRTNELAEREALLAGEIGGLRSFEAKRDDLIGDRATGGWAKEIFDKQSTALDDMQSEITGFQGTGAPGTTAEGSRTKLIRDIYGEGTLPGGSLAESRELGPAQNYGQRLENIYQDYLTTMSGIRDAREDTISGFGEKYTVAGSPTGDTSSEEYKAQQKFKDAWETQIKPGYEDTVGEKRSSYGDKLATITKDRDDDIKDTIKESKKDIRDVQSELRDLDLEATRSRRDIRGFEGGGLRSGKRARLGGEEAQKVADKRRQLLAKQRDIRQDRKTDIRDAREDARVDIDELTTKTEGDIFELQDDQTGARFDIQRAAQLSAEDLTAAEQGLWSESEEAERSALDEVLTLEDDATNVGSVKKQIQDIEDVESARYTTVGQDALQDIKDQKQGVYENIMGGGDKEIIPDLAKDLFTGPDSIMKRANAPETRAQASDASGKTYGSVSPIPMSDMKESRELYAKNVAEAQPWSFKNLGQQANTTFNAARQKAQEVAPTSNWAGSLRDAMDRAVLDSVASERGGYFGKLSSAYGGTGEGSLAYDPVGGMKQHYMPDFFTQAANMGASTNPVMAFGAQYHPSVMGNRSGSNEGLIGWGATTAGFSSPDAGTYSWGQPKPTFSFLPVSDSAWEGFDDRSQDTQFLPYGSVSQMSVKPKRGKFFQDNLAGT